MVYTSANSSVSDQYIYLGQTLLYNIGDLEGLDDESLSDVGVEIKDDVVEIGNYLYYLDSDYSILLDTSSLMEDSNESIIGAHTVEVTLTYVMPDQPQTKYSFDIHIQEDVYSQNINSDGLNESNSNADPLLYPKEMSVNALSVLDI